MVVVIGSGGTKDSDNANGKKEYHYIITTTIATNAIIQRSRCWVLLVMVAGGSGYEC